MLAMTHLGGFGAGRFARPEYALSLGSASDLELLTWVRNSTGWNGIDPCKVTVNVVSGAIINASWTGGYALYIRNFPLECELFLNILGIARIVGCGGAGGIGGVGGQKSTAGGAGGQGGPALYVGSRCNITNSGIIGAGGGGGGGGGGGYRTGTINRSFGGGGGGGGAGSGPGGAGGPGTSGLSNAGVAGTLSAGGAGGAATTWGSSLVGGVGGNGGAFGAVGLAGASDDTAGGPGGATNYAVYGNSNIAWLAVGTILGWVA